MELPSDEAGQAEPPQDPGPAAGAADQQAGKMIAVTIVTSYEQGVRYWIQDVAVDFNNEVALGQGRVLVNGDVHAGGDAIPLTCLETQNGAAVGYMRESSPPEQGGGGQTPWTHVLISEGQTATMIL